MREAWTFYRDLWSLRDAEGAWAGDAAIAFTVLILVLFVSAWLFVRTKG